MQLSKNLFYALLLIVLGNECAFGQTYFVRFGIDNTNHSQKINDYKELGGNISIECRDYPQSSFLLNVGFARRINSTPPLNKNLYYINKSAAISAEFRYYFSPEKHSFYAALCPTYYVFYSRNSDLSDFADTYVNCRGVSGKFGYKRAISKLFSLELNTLGGFYTFKTFSRVREKRTANFGSLNMTIGIAL